MKCPRPESNQRTRFRKPLLYPLSYGGPGGSVAQRRAAEILAVSIPRKRTASRRLRTHVVVLPVTEELGPLGAREVAVGDVAGFCCPVRGIDAPYDARA
jgi:hypothetical protein